jgi:hypothetical protein
MPIHELRILPPLAIARFGSSPTPLEAYDLRVREDDPMAFREIVPKETLEVDNETGEIIRCYVPGQIHFRDKEKKIRPVAPFLDVYACTSEDCLEPLTLGMLSQEGLTDQDVHWSVEVANIKAFRQTLDPKDKVEAKTGIFHDHDIQVLKGTSPHFLTGRSIYFGQVRYIAPTPDFPEIRLRFTPAQGKVYGSTLYIQDPDTGKEIRDPVFCGDETRIVYNTKDGGKWLGFQTDQRNPFLTNPNDIYEGAEQTDGFLMGPSKGYFDDVCDGRVSLELRTKDGRVLQAHSWISACMPAFAPDSQPVRSVADELEQLILGPDVTAGSVSIEDAAEIVRRALETMRLMNTAVMNGNVIYGRPNVAHTLITQDTNDYGRTFAPIISPSMVDNLAVRQLHERVYAALRSGSAPWFAQVLRRPEEVGDMTDKGRRKMPPMLRGADSRALALTRRQIAKILEAAK